MCEPFRNAETQNISFCMPASLEFFQKIASLITLLPGTLQYLQAADEGTFDGV